MVNVSEHKLHICIIHILYTYLHSRWSVSWCQSMFHGFSLPSHPTAKNTRSHGPSKSPHLGRCRRKNHHQRSLADPHSFCAQQRAARVCWNCWQAEFLLLKGTNTCFTHVSSAKMNEHGWNMGMLITKNRTKNRNVIDISGTLLSPVACRSFSTNVERPVFEDRHGEMEPHPHGPCGSGIRLVDQKWIKRCFSWNTTSWMFFHNSNSTSALHFCQLAGQQNRIEPEKSQCWMVWQPQT